MAHDLSHDFFRHAKAAIPFIDEYVAEIGESGAIGDDASKADLLVFEIGAEA